jgi:hypothetical protein
LSQNPGRAETQQHGCDDKGFFHLLLRSAGATGGQPAIPLVLLFCWAAMSASTDGSSTGKVSSKMKWVCFVHPGASHYIASWSGAV